MKRRTPPSKTCKDMFRITKTTFIKRDGSMEHSNEVVDVQDLEEYRARLKGSKYARVNFIYSEIDDNEGDSADSELAPADKPGETE